MADDAPLGIKCKTFLNTGNVPTPIWSLLNDISDESLQITYDEAQGDRRGAAVGESEPTVRRCELTLKLLKDEEDPLWLAMQTAFLARDRIDIMALSCGARVFAGNDVLDAANSTGTGVRYYGKMFGFGENRGLNEVLFNETTVKPCLKSNFKTVSIDAGTLTFTTPPAA